MSRYIDADALVEEIWKKHKETEEMFDVCVDELKEVYCGVVATIDAQPTAYDVDAVEAELEVLRDLSNADQQLVVSQAIGIVKRGGMK